MIIHYTDPQSQTIQLQIKKYEEPRKIYQFAALYEDFWTDDRRPKRDGLKNRINLRTVLALLSSANSGNIFEMKTLVKYNREWEMERTSDFFEKRSNYG